MGGRREAQEGTYVHLWLIHVNIHWKATQYCKAIILQLKIGLGYKKEMQMMTTAMKLKLLLGRKAMTNLDSILKSRDITLLTKVWSKPWFFQ